jgi:small basic protein
VSGVLFFGSHNLTLLLAVSVLAVTALAVLVCVPSVREHITRRGIVRVAGVVVPAAMVSAWYLIPDALYQSRTRIAGEFLHAQESLRSTSGLVSTGHLFTFSRDSALGIPSSYPFALSLPVLAIVWAVVGLLILTWGNHNRTWTRIFVICAVLAVLVTIAMTHVGILLALPRPYVSMQFSYRLETYVLLMLCAAILAALVLAHGSSRRMRIWRWMALPVCVVSLAGAIQQISAYPYPGQDRYAALQSYGEVETGNNEDFQDTSAPVIKARNLPVLRIPFTAVHADEASFSLSVKPGTLIDTNISAGSYFVHITGATPVGLDAKGGHMVLESGSARTVTVSAGDGLPILLGRMLSGVGLAVLALELLGVTVSHLRGLDRDERPRGSLYGRVLSGRVRAKRRP